MTLRGLAMQFAYLIDTNTPIVEGLSADTQAGVEHIAQALLGANHPLIVSGCQLGSPAILRAAACIAQALQRAGRTPGILFAVPECNSLGLALMQGGSVQNALAAAEMASGVIVLENDLYRRADRPSVDALFNSAATTIVLDNIQTETLTKADIALPCANFAESEGSFVNAEGRAQRFFKAVFRKDDVQPSWLWLSDLGYTAERVEMENWHRFDDVVQALGAALPVFATFGAAAPDKFRAAGSRIRSEPHRYSGRTAIDANRTMHEPRASMPEDAPFSSTMEGYYGEMPPALIPFFWAPGWNSGQSLHKFQDETGLALQGGDPGVRLLEPRSGDGSIWAHKIPAAFVRIPGRWLIVPHSHIFGSEELSAQAPAIAERRGAAFLSVNMTDAETLGAKNGDEIEVTLDGGHYCLPLLIAPELVSGLATMSAFLPGTAGHELPGWATLRRVSKAESASCG